MVPEPIPVLNPYVPEVKLTALFDVNADEYEGPSVELFQRFVFQALVAEVDVKDV